jgi:tetratricopeptide (TPR) repeat protein
MSRSGRRRTRIGLLVTAAGFAGIAAGLVAFRASPPRYVPGADAGAEAQITRRLERGLPDDVPEVRFVDVAGATGLRFAHFQGTRSHQLPEDMGSGLAWGDYDGDGDPDLFLVDAAPLPGAGGSRGGSALFRNDAGRFVDVTDAAGARVEGCGLGAAWGDYDADGDLDLAVSRYGTNRLLRNDGRGRFSDVSEATGVGGPEGFWTGLSWADYDRDGDLDLYVCGYVRYRYDPGLAGRTSLQYRAQVPYTLNPSTYPPERNLLFRNDGGRFREVAAEAGVDNPAGRSLSASWSDLDGDGRVDLYVANDISDNALYRNLGDGRFEDVSHRAWVADHRGAMGLAVGDWNGDADLDIVVTHWIAQENALYDNQAADGAEGLRFLDIADQVGLGQSSLDFIGWGTDFLDYDNDGRLDLFVANGSTFEQERDRTLLVPMRNQLFWNGGGRRGFFDAGSAAGPAMAVEGVGRGAAFADFDSDGDLDVAVATHRGPARLLRNDGGNARGWVRVVLRGNGRSSPTFATGAVVRLQAGGSRQVRQLEASSSYLSQSPPGEAWFGVGDAARVDSLEITWPDGSRQALSDLPVRSTVRVVQGRGPEVSSASAPANAAAAPAAPLDRSGVLRFWRLVEQATALRNAGRCADAVPLYADALRLNPRHEDSLYYLGQCSRDLGRHDEARRAFAALLAENPASARGHLGMGALLASPEDRAPLDLREALLHLERAHEINSEETGAVVRMGEILIVMGDRARAGHWLEAALRTNPRSVEAAFLLGYLRWSRSDRTGASAAYAAALRAAAADAPVRGVLGEGDRRAAAPPLRNPMGETLFGAFAEPIRGGAAPAEPDLDRLYGPVRARAAELARRAGVGS